MMAKNEKSEWFPFGKMAPDASLRLFCFSYAGGNASIFRSWHGHFQPTVEIFPLQIPGHGTRMQEAPLTRMKPLAEAASKARGAYLDKPFAFYGHSMGATLGFEIAHKLRAVWGVEPAHFFVSGRRGPQRAAHRVLHNLPKPRFIEELKRLNGTPEEVLQSEELLDLLIPMLRADFEVLETYQYSERPALTCPITAMGGTEDHEITREDIDAWGQVTSGKFESHMLSGGHFFLHTAQEQVLRIVSEQLQPLVSQTK